MKRTFLALAAAALILGLDGCSFKVTRPMLQMVVSRSNRISTDAVYADSLEKRLNVPYVEGGTSEQVFDIYYAAPEKRKDAALIDIHGGFYVAGRHQNNRRFTSAFLKEGYDVVLVEYRLNDGKTDVSDELADCSAALDFLATHSGELGINKDRMFLTGDSAGGHLALYMAEGAADPAVPIRPKVFKPRGVMLNCPAYDFASFAEMDIFAKSAFAWFIGPRYKDRQWLDSVSPRTFIGSFTCPLFVSTCTHDFIRDQALLIKSDCDSLGRKIEFLDIQSNDRRVGHVHNVSSYNLPESKTVNDRMVAFMDEILK